MISFVDLDLTSAEGWVEGLERGRNEHARDEIFAYVAHLGFTPETLQGFEQCPTFDHWT